ncbi:CAAX farnesyltransferase (FTase) subunit beta [Podospora pseudopauciseta]|uniref:CAAX farnesyltransferase (FTase) subunit beta n=1 Tax=Podospora pseudopauciseta TaxID=2093780 RepID=A0ABR0HDQ0_9PEZI|nr:CAAX farnesyltransferase (FTase) subunit beta [Podospora pseudopauciseta]
MSPPSQQKRVLFSWKNKEKKTTSTTMPTSQSPPPGPSQQPPPQATTSSQPDDLEVVTDDNDSDYSSIDSEIPFSTPNLPPSMTTMMIDSLFTTPPPLHDPLITPTSTLQDETLSDILPFLSSSPLPPDLFTYNAYNVPSLRREAHIAFLHASLGRLPGKFVAADASRPWFLYWCLSGLAMLGEDVSRYRDSVKETARSMQNGSGGFGGGGGQLSHLATSYAVVLALAIVGAEEGFEVIDRRQMWRWLGGLKQRDGGFEVSVIITLLDLPLDLTPESPAYKPDDPSFNLLSGVADYVRRCQTYEGGISSSPSAEAHGAYAFCALGCLSLLGPPSITIPETLNLPSLLSWLSSRQYAPEGGFSGRTNKLVDGCYSHWVGACFPLIEAALANSPTPVNDSLFSREGLIRYILNCCQDETKRGGLRDKPGKMSDAYHSCYVLSGLSAGMHQWVLEDEEWMVLPYLEGEQVFENADRVRPVHPVYVIPQGAVRAMRGYFRGKGGFN